MVIKTSLPTTPPLIHGDKLSRHEFERRYAAMPENIKAELIEGVVYMASPVSSGYHGAPHSLVVGWLVQYHAFTPGTLTAVDGTVRLDLENEPQPDAFLFVEPAKGGQVVMEDGGYVANAPELVIEVAASTADIDMKKKLPVYCRNGVREYIVWRVYDNAIDWFILRDGQYVPIADDQGVRKSEVFPGLWLDAPALLRRDMKEVLEMLQRGLASPEHADFLKRLNG